MKRASIILLTIALAVFPIIPSGRGYISVAVDNAHIQTYRGQVGRWVSLSGEPVRALAARFDTTVEKVLEINDGAIRGSYAFIPMGQQTYRALLQKGNGRRILELDPRKLLWPVEVPNYTSRFGQRWGQLHTGLDMACATGTVVVAAADGVVIAAGWQGGLGQAVALQHDDGTQTWYAHNSVLLLKSGEKVRRGQVIALAGATGRATGPHVHMEVRFMDVFLNPEDFIQYGLISPETVLREVPPMESSDVAQRSDVPAAAPVAGN